MARQTLKTLQHLLQDFEIVSDHFGILCMNGLNQNYFKMKMKTNTSEKVATVFEN